MAETFLLLSAQDRRDALGVAADRSGRPAHLLEKDVWVVWALSTLYTAPLGEHLVFKGGTSLSKAYQVIHRFSEDVDLTYDIRAIAPDLVGDNGEGLPKTRSQEKRWSSEVRRRLPEWVAAAVQPVIADSLATEGLAATIRVEGDRLFIDYEPTAVGSGYVAPSVMLEFGARSTGEPASLRDVICDASGLIDGLIFPTARPRVAQPTEEEATAAVRRHRLFTGTSLANATLKLGDCSPGGVGLGVTCMTQIVLDSTKPNATPQNRPVGFARVNGQWEVAVW